MNSLSIAVFSALFATAASSQALAQHDCRDVYVNAVRNVSADHQISGVKRQYFATYCAASGDLRDSARGIDLRIPIREIVVGFSGSERDAEIAMREFCRTQSQVQTEVSESSRWRDEVVVDALSSFNACVSLAQKGLNVFHVPSAFALTFEFDFDPTRTRVEFEGISYNHAEGECSSSGFSTEVNGRRARTRIDESTPGQSMPRHFSIICERPQATRGVGVAKGRLSVSVSTNQGTYTAVLPGDPPPESPCEPRLRSCRDAADDLNRELANRQQSCDLRLRQIEERPFHLVRQGQNAMGGASEHVPCPGSGGNVAQYAASVCGQGRPHGLRRMGAHRGGACGYTYYIFSCLPPPAP
jgi:hypothetical protein